MTFLSIRFFIDITFYYNYIKIKSNRVYEMLNIWRYTCNPGRPSTPGGPLGPGSPGTPGSPWQRTANM